MNSAVVAAMVGLFILLLIMVVFTMISSASITKAMARL
jgi:hypothetical protein